MELAHEWQFDGLVGPTHNYAGLAMGNLAAKANAGGVSNPKEAALQGIRKMRFVRDLGVRQAFLPPHYRPLIPELKRLGFEGSKIEDILEAAARYSPGLLASVYSSSFMWTANAATITPSVDSEDGRVHITPANMSSHYHRAIESYYTYRTLGKIFHNPQFFSVHNPLFPHVSLGDEGAANHMLVCTNHGDIGTHIFVVGDNPVDHFSPSLFPARQRLIASEAVSRLHKINKNQCLFLQQSPQAIDKGVFHNDVIAMNTTRHVLVHAEAFITHDQEQLCKVMSGRKEIKYREIQSHELTVEEAVSTYFFNSQLLELSESRFALIAPSETNDYKKSHDLVQTLIMEGLLDEVHYLDLRESMRNGGGPACLRLRVVMTEEEAASIHPGVVLTDDKFSALEQWVNRFYRDRLTADDLRDPEFVSELHNAYLALESLIGMDGLYSEPMSLS